MSKMASASDNRIIVGWREWVSLPELQLPAIEAKVDTGAKTSALHAFFVERFRRNGSDFVRFRVHPLQRNSDLVIESVSPLVDERMVSDSGGHQELRCVIETQLDLGADRWPIEMTLTNRDSMRFRMLIGRTAMKSRIQVNPSASYLTGKLDYRKLYHQVPKRPTSQEIGR